MCSVFDLFEDGVHLATYKKGDVQEAAEKVRYYLDHPEEAAAIGRRGREEILAKHLYKHRAARVIELCEEVAISKKRWQDRYLSWMINCSALASRLLKLDTELSRQAWVFAVKAAEAGIRNGETLTEPMSFRFVNACNQFDRMNNSKSGVGLLEIAHQRFPDLSLVTLALMREYLNSGRRAEAELLAGKVCPDDPPTTTFQNAETVITTLIHDGCPEESFAGDTSVIDPV